jgi:hypothetical protein
MPQLSRRFLLTFLSLSLACAAVFLAPAFAEPQKQVDDESKLAVIMDGLRDATKALGRALEAKDAAASWSSVCSLQARILEAKQESPSMAESLPAADRPALLAAFRTKLSEALKASCDLEVAVLAARYDDAAKLLREITGPMQKAAHREFRKDD